MRPVLFWKSPLLAILLLHWAACSRNESPPQPAPLERVWQANALREFCFRATPETIEHAFGPPHLTPSSREWIYQRVLIGSSADNAPVPTRLHLIFKHDHDNSAALQVSEIRLSP